MQSRENKEVKVKSAESSIHIILDIDETLAYREYFPSHSLQNITRDFYRRKLKPEDIIEYSLNEDEFKGDVLCLLHPGVREFIQYISQIPGVNLSFFSNAIPGMNFSFVEQLLGRALGNKNHLLVTIFSRQHCTDNKKNIKEIIGKKESLDRVLLIDDRESVVYPDQRKNALITHGPKDRDLIQVDGRNFFDVNHIFYIVGLLAEALESGDENFLDRIQNSQKKKENLKWSYYLRGLAELRKINPELYFSIGNRLRTLSKVTEMGCPYVVEDLLNNSEEKIESSEKNTSLHIATRNGNVEILTLLLKHHANIEARDAEENTPFIIAAKFGHLKIVNFLFEQGADINARNSKGENALFFAFNNNDKLISALFQQNEHYKVYNKTHKQGALQDWVSSMNNKMDVVILYNYLKRTMQLSEHKAWIGEIKKIAQMHILTLQHLEKQSSHQKQNPIIERHIRDFLKTSILPFFKNPLLDKYLMSQTNTLDEKDNISAEKLGEPTTLKNDRLQEPEYKALSQESSNSFRSSKFCIFSKENLGISIWKIIKQISISCISSLRIVFSISGFVESLRDDENHRYNNHNYSN